MTANGIVRTWNMVKFLPASLASSLISFLEQEKSMVKSCKNNGRRI